MYLENVIEVLRRNGIEAEIVEVYKNGNPLRAICLHSENVSTSPVIYPRQGESTTSLLKRAKDAMLQSLTIDMEELHDKDYIKCNSFICIQRRSDEPVLKRPLLNLEVVVRLAVKAPDGYTGSLKVDEGFCRISGMDVDEIWEYAMSNTRDRVSIRSMSELLGYPDGFGCPFYVATIEDIPYGAASLAFPSLFDAFCASHGCSHIWILPSSCEELLLLPDDDQTYNAEMLSAMVLDVNSESGVVSSEIQLDPVVYEYHKSDGIIRLGGGAVIA